MSLYLYMYMYSNAQNKGTIYYNLFLIKSNNHRSGKYLMLEIDFL